MSREEWRSAVGFEGRYEVSSFGRVKSLNYKGKIGKAQILIPNVQLNNHFYHKYSLMKDGGKVVTVLVHRLVMVTFSGDANGRFIDHIDGNGANNRLDNLRYCTHRENLTFDNVKFKNKRWSEFPGVHYNKNSNGKNKWRSIIQIDNKKINIGTFATELDAAEAYQNKLKEVLCTIGIQ